ncbi:MAG: sialate O-acetylesterase [Victivallales bacterium]
MNGLFSDHMVLQRNHPISVSGRSRPGEPIHVELAGQSILTTAGQDGVWQIKFLPLPAGGPHQLTVRSSDECIQLQDVMIGEVWVCSGQSNMDFRLGQTKDNKSALGVADHQPLLRLLVMPRVWKPGGDRQVEAVWRLSTPQTASDFSAVGYQFGIRLARELGVAIGLIDAARGGSRIHNWTPRQELAADPEFAPRLKDYLMQLTQPADERTAEYRKKLAAWQKNMPPSDPGMTGEAEEWAALEYDDSKWPTMRLPCWWQRGGQDHSGVLWFRYAFELPKDFSASGISLHLGACDKADHTYVNGTLVGGIGPEVVDGWRAQRVYPLPAGLLRPGRNMIAVRVFSNINQAGMTGPAVAMRLVGGDWSRPLAGVWKYNVEHNFGQVIIPPSPWGAGNPDSPSILFESLVAPLRIFRLAGAIWYQGESDEYEPDGYRRLFPAMIRGWRRVWGQDFHFLFVQLPSFGSDQPVQTLWAELREAQTSGLAEPHTAMIPSIDIGDPNDLHPQNKQEVGRRLAMAALAAAYGDTRPGLLAPALDKVLSEGGCLRLKLLHVEAGLRWQGGILNGFEVAGDDGKFVAAEALLDGSDIIVWNAGVVKPVMVRYAWADNPVANVCDFTGMPLIPFGSARAKLFV